LKKPCPPLGNGHRDRARWDRKPPERDLPDENAKKNPQVKITVRDVAPKPKGK
jgi:hypothetical protein